MEYALLDLPVEGIDEEWENDFASQFQFVEYDRRGCYRSSCPDSRFDLLTQASDLEGLLDHLGIASAHLIGSSAGGPIAVVFGATRPERTRSLTLAGTGMTLFPKGDSVTEVILQQIEILETDGAEAAFESRPDGVEVSLGVLWEPPEHVERGEIEQYWAKQRALNERAQQRPRDQRVHYYNAELKSIKGYFEIELGEYAAQITAPTLALHGSRDRTVPVAWGEELAGAIPGSHFEVVDGKSHTLVVRDQETRNRVASFVRQTEAGK